METPFAVMRQWTDCRKHKAVCLLLPLPVLLLLLLLPLLLPKSLYKKEETLKHLVASHWGLAALWSLLSTLSGDKDG